MSEALWFVYIIATEKNRLYTGITTDVERRFKEHSGELSRGAKFFRSDKPQKIVYVETCSTKSEALIKEARIKKLSRVQKDNFIKGQKNGDDKIHARRKE